MEKDGGEEHNLCTVKNTQPLGSVRECHVSIENEKKKRIEGHGNQQQWANYM